MRLIDKNKLLAELNELEQELDNKLTNVLNELDVRLFTQRLGSWQTVRDIIEIIEKSEEYPHQNSKCEIKSLINDDD